jgi:hypothetical protein
MNAVSPPSPRAIHPMWLRSRLLLLRLSCRGRSRLWRCRVVRRDHEIGSDNQDYDDRDDDQVSVASHHDLLG